VAGESSFLIPFLKPAIEIVKASLRAARRRWGKRKYDQLVSAVIVELLKENPDLDLAEAKLRAINATDAQPDMNLLRAQRMLFSTKLFAFRKASRLAGGWEGTPKKRWAKRSKTGQRPRRAAKSRNTKVRRK
jgi:hypothetical protein